MKNILIKSILLFSIIIFGLSFTSDAQVLSCNNKINFHIKNDSLYVVDNRLNMMPMVRYEFIFYLKNHSPVSLIYIPNKFNGKISIKILEAKLMPLKSYSLEKIIIHSSFNTYETDIINDKQYFIKNL